MKFLQKPSAWQPCSPLFLLFSRKPKSWKQYEAHLDFPVGKSVILPDFMNNQIGLRNIQNMLNKIHGDKKPTITNVYIERFASPEGSLQLNEQPSQNLSHYAEKTVPYAP